MVSVCFCLQTRKQQKEDIQFSASDDEALICPLAAVLCNPPDTHRVHQHVNNDADIAAVYTLVRSKYTSDLRQMGASSGPSSCVYFVTQTHLTSD